MKIITIGALRMTLPSFITAICGMTIGVSLLFVMPQLWPMSLMIVAAFLVGAYNVNCAVVGNCNAWAWILATVYIVYTLIVVGAMFFRKQLLNEYMNKKK